MKGLEQLLRGGVVGGGGAGFPTWKKLAAPAEQLLINGAECEPLLKIDQYLMGRYPEALVEAAAHLAALVGAREAIICLKDHYTAQIAALRKALEGAAVTPPVRLHLLPTVYPIGDEQSLIHSATGKTVPPGALPGAVRCTVCSVSTALNALRALQGKPVTSRFVTVAGEVRRPGVYRAPVGMPVSMLLQEAGAATSGCRLMLGGPMMGTPAPMDTDAVVTKTLGGVLVLPQTHMLIRHAELPMEKARVRARSTCIQCRTCTDLCPRYLLGHPIYPHLSMRAFASGAQRLEVFQLLRPTGLKINVEMKNSVIDYPDLERRVIELAAQEGMLERILFSSFNHFSLLRVKKMDPSLPCGLLYDAAMVTPWAYAVALGMDAIHPNFTEVLLQPGECASAHRAGIQVNPWTVNEAEDLRACLKAGADILISNYPDRALTLLKEHEAQG